MHKLPQLLEDGVSSVLNKPGKRGDLSNIVHKDPRLVDWVLMTPKDMRSVVLRDFGVQS